MADSIKIPQSGGAQQHQNIPGEPNGGPGVSNPSAPVQGSPPNGSTGNAQRQTPHVDRLEPNAGGAHHSRPHHDKKVGGGLHGAFQSTNTTGGINI